MEKYEGHDEGTTPAKPTGDVNLSSPATHQDLSLDPNSVNSKSGQGNSAE